MTKSAEFVVSNTNSDNKYTDAIVALKDKSGKLLGVRFEGLNLDAGTTKFCSISSEFENVSSYDVIECYVWDSLGSMKLMVVKKRIEVQQIYK